MREHAGSVSADELAWRFLGGFFPERSSTDYSWRNWEEMQEQAQQEIAWAADFNALSVDTLYRVMLNATIKRESPEFEKLSSRVNTAVFDLWHNLPTILDFNSVGNTNMVVAGSNSAMTTLDPSAISRQILPPLEGDPDTALRLPLVPAHAIKGSKRWLSVLDPTAPMRLVELSLKVPGTAIIVRLSGPVQQELAAVLGLACYMFGSGMLDAKSITLVGVMAVLSRVRSLRAEFGERSIIDALGEVDRKIKENVTIALYGKPCRYPKANCRYLASDRQHCAIETSQVSATIDDLVRRNILRSRSAVEPIEYSVVI